LMFCYGIQIHSRYSHSIRLKCVHLEAAPFSGLSVLASSHRIDTSVTRHLRHRGSYAD
jgi:hypothetical protein